MACLQAPPIAHAHGPHGIGSAGSSLRLTLNRVESGATFPQDRPTHLQEHAGRRNLRCLLSPPFSYPVVRLGDGGIILYMGVNGLHHRPSEPSIPLLPDASMPHHASRCVGGGHESSVAQRLSPAPNMRTSPTSTLMRSPV